MSSSTAPAPAKKSKTSWFKRIGLFTLLFLLLLFVLLVVAYVVRIPLLNYSLKQSLPDGIQVSIGALDIAALDRNINISDLDVTLREPAFEGELDVAIGQIDLQGIDYSALASEAALKLQEQEKKGQQSKKDQAFDAKQLADAIESKIKALLSDKKSQDADSVSETDHNVLADRFQVEGIDVVMKTSDMSLKTKLKAVILNGIDYTYSENHDVVLDSFNIKGTDVVVSTGDMSVDLDLATLALGKLDYTYLTSVKKALDQHDVKLAGIKLSALNVKLDQAETNIHSSFQQLSLGGIQFKKAAANLKRLGLEALTVNLSQPGVPVNAVDLASLNLSKVNVAIEKGDVTLDTLSLNKVDAKLDVWKWVGALSALELNQLSLSNWSEKITLARTHLDSLALDVNNKKAVNLSELAVNDISFSDQNLLIDQVHLTSPQIHLIKAKNGSINVAPPVKPEDTEAKKEADTQKESDTTAEENPLQYVVNQIVINDQSSKGKPIQNKKTDQKQQGYVRWEDKSAASSVDLMLTIDELKVTDLDSLSHKKARAVKHRVKHEGKDGLLAQAAGKTHVMLRSKLSGDSPLNLDAWFDVSKIETDFAAIVDLKHMELPLVSPYTVDTIGYKIRSGQFSTHVDVASVSSTLNGNINLKLLGADLIPADKNTMERFNKELTMPLPTALNLLEDRNKEIELDMPLDGSLDDPSFSAKGVMRFVMLRAIKEATVYYVKSALLPQNTLFSVVDMFGGMVYNKLTELPAIKYKKAQVELTSAHKAFLDNVAKTMKKKDKLRFRVCGSASPLDGDKALAINLAGQRTKAIRSYLVQKHNIATERLMQCLANYDEKLKQSEVKLIL